MYGAGSIHHVVTSHQTTTFNHPGCDAFMRTVNAVDGTSTHVRRPSNALGDLEPILK